jgi:outer membrane protein TolC
MVHPPKFWIMLMGGLVAVLGGCAATPYGPQPTPPPLLATGLIIPSVPAHAEAPNLPALPTSQPDDRPLPINLPSALQLANVRAVDVAAAAERMRVAAAVLEQAQVLWLPTVTFGADYLYHAGPIQDVSNTVFNDSHSGLMVGGGSGIGNAAVISVTDAIFAPLAARQQVRARLADRQAASNDTLVAVSDAYFTVQQARGELAGAIEATRKTNDLIMRTRKLAPEIIAELELFRVETELASRQKTDLLARERWKVASAELVRLLRMDSLTQVEPLEPPQLLVELIDLKKPVIDLIPVALTNRPELASQQAQVLATLELLKQERWRPFLPNILLRGASTSPGGTLAGGWYSPAPNGSGAGMRGDLDLQLLWQLENLGFGNVAKTHKRQAENRAALIDLLRIEDRVAAEVAQAYAQAQFAASRVEVAERGVRSAVQSVDKNLIALGQTKGAGALTVTLVRPQEVVAAIQALSQAYIDYYGAVADANRAQFRLYRALGQPAQYLIQDERMPTMCATAPPASAPMNRTPDETRPGATLSDTTPSPAPLTRAPEETHPVAARFLTPKVVADTEGHHQ